MYLKLNNNNWRRLKKGEIRAEQQKMKFEEECQLNMKLEVKKNEKWTNGFK